MGCAPLSAAETFFDECEDHVGVDLSAHIDGWAAVPCWWGGRVCASKVGPGLASAKAFRLDTDRPGFGGEGFGGEEVGDRCRVVDVDPVDAVGPLEELSIKRQSLPEQLGAWRVDRSDAIDSVLG